MRCLCSCNIRLLRECCMRNSSQYDFIFTSFQKRRSVSGFQFNLISFSYSIASLLTVISYCYAANAVLKNIS